MYVKSLIPQEGIPKKFFDLIEELGQKGQVFVKIIQGEDFHSSRNSGEFTQTNCWIEICTEPMPLEDKPVWVTPRR